VTDMRFRPDILIAVLAAGALLATSAPAKDPEMGSRTRQLLLKKALGSGSLADELSRNRRRWEAMTPEQRRALRDRFLAFVGKDPARQADLIRAFEAFQKLTPQQQEQYRRRAVWLKKVVASLTPEQREALKKLTPDERARKLLELKAALSRPGPTTRPTTTSAPAEPE